MLRPHLSSPMVQFGGNRSMEWLGSLSLVLRLGSDSKKSKYPRKYAGVVAEKYTL